MNFCVITFTSTHSAMLAQRYLSRHFKVTVMPTLREISMGCGISLRFDSKYQELAYDKMSQFDLDKELYNVYSVSLVEGKYKAELISN